MNSAKRRRLNEPSPALSKPFRSPLKSNRASQDSSSSQNARDNNAREAPERYLDHKDDATPQVSNLLLAPTAVEPASNVKDSSQISSNHANTSTDVANTVKALKKEHAILTQQLQQHRKDLAALQQSLNIRSTNQEGKTNLLIAKWRNIARDAADDLFESASSRVKEMGGLQAWQDNSLHAYTTDWNDPEGHNCSSSERDTVCEDDREQEHEAENMEAMGATNHEVSETVSQ